MNDSIKLWLIHLYEGEIEETESALATERMWEYGCKGREQNPHTDNIKCLNEYIKVLKGKIKELKEV